MAGHCGADRRVRAFENQWLVHDAAHRLDQRAVRRFLLCAVGICDRAFKRVARQPKRERGRVFLGSQGISPVAVASLHPGAVRRASSRAGGCECAGRRQETAGLRREFSLIWLPYNLLLVQAWEVTPYNTWNEPAWSISTEVFAYIVFAGAFVAFGARAFAVMLAACAGLLAYALASPEVMQATYTAALARCLLGFFVGVSVYWLWTRCRGMVLPAPSVIEGATIVVMAAAVTLLPKQYGVMVIPVFALCVFVFAFQAGALSAALLRAPFVWLGERSYSIYLCHAFLVTLMFSGAAVLGMMGKLDNGKTAIVAAPVVSDALIVGFLLATIAFSALSYTYIEVPGRRAGRNIRF
jgi:peptidoglycan/LPS O-acetylase OafA/YrhL